MNRAKHFFISLILICFATTGCANTEIKPNTRDIETTSEEETHTTGWWRVSFVIFWPEDENDPDDIDNEPLWHIGTMVGHQIISPLLDKHRDEIKYWRFHRRAGRDDTGHRFSFYFYGKPELAKEIYASVEEHPLIGELIERELLLKMDYEDHDSIKKPNLADNADKRWEDKIKQTWPTFIRGISETWLELVDIHAQEADIDKLSSTDELLAAYEQVQQDVQALWEEDAKHAYFHHISGIFNYAPIKVRY